MTDTDKFLEIHHLVITGKLLSDFSMPTFLLEFFGVPSAYELFSVKDLDYKLNILGGIMKSDISVRLSVDYRNLLEFLLGWPFEKTETIVDRLVSDGKMRFIPDREVIWKIQESRLMYN